MSIYYYIDYIDKEFVNIWTFTTKLVVARYFARVDCTTVFIERYEIRVIMTKWSSAYHNDMLPVKYGYICCADHRLISIHSYVVLLKIYRVNENRACDIGRLSIPELNYDIGDPIPVLTLWTPTPMTANNRLSIVFIICQFKN